MKKGLLSCIGIAKYTLLFVALLFSDFILAQPQFAHDPSSGTSANTIPFNQAATGSNRRQTLFYPTDFTNPTPGFITKIYYKASVTVTPDLKDVKIFLSTTSLSALAAGPFVTNGATQVLNAQTFTVIPLPGNWIAFSLQTPFYWNATSNLIVDVQQGGNTTGFSILQSTLAGRSLIGNAQAAAASAQGSLAVFGFDVATAMPCVSPPVVGNTKTNSTQVCPNDVVFLSVDTMSYGLGQTLQWQFSTDSVSWANMPNDTLNTLTTTVASTRFYRIQITCGTTITSATPVKIKVLTTPIVGGTYTINSVVPTAGANFNSFQDFFTLANCAGITGPIVLNVVSNVSGYNEQIYVGAVTGLSATNTIKINGNNAVLTNVGGTANRATLTIDGASYISIKNLVIEGTGLINSYGVELRNNANHISFDSCTVRANLSASATTSAAFVTSNSATSPTAAGLAASNLTLTNSIIEGGYYCLVINGPSAAPYSENNVIENNEIRDFYYYGVYVRGQDNSSFKNNDIHRTNATSISSFYGMYVTGNITGTNFFGNKLHNSNDNGNAGTTNYPLYLSSAKGTAASPATFANNVIYNINNTGVLYGVYITSSDYVRFYHNTVNLNDAILGTSVSNIRGLFVNGTTGNFEFKNNIFNLDISGSGIKYLIYVSSAVPNYIFNNNQYYFTSTGGSNTFGYFGANVADFTAWQALKNSAFDQNGVYASPTFDGIDMITPQTTAGNGAGINVLSEVPTDIFGTARTTTPDIGAVEYTPQTCLQPLGFAGNSTSTSIILTWINDVNADSVHIEYGLSGFNQGTGTGVNVSGSTFTAAGLLSNTCYDFYVYTWCNGTAGNAVALFTFCTQCGAKTVPFAENFDSTPAGTSATFPNVPNCWFYYKSGISTSVYGFNTTSTGPNSGLNHWRMYRNNLIDTVAIVSPEIGGLTVGDKRVRFWAKSNTINDTRMIIGTVASPEAMNTFAPIDTFYATQNYTEFVKTFNVATGYNGTHKYIAFMLSSTTAGQNLYLDDISFEALPQCAAPIGVNADSTTSTTAKISWGSINGTCFRLEYGPAGFSHSTGQGTIINGATSLQTITGLTPNTYYDVYVFDCCNYGLPSLLHTFKTDCIGPLSGAYTINQNTTASTTNFVSFESFIQAVENCGVNGPVVANVVSGSGPYIEQVVMTSFPGASATNTVTINGNGSELSFYGGVANKRGTLTLDDASRIVLKNLTISGTGTLNSYAVEFRNGTNNVIIDSCTIKSSTTTISTTVCAIVFTDNPNSPTAASGAFNNNTISNSIVEGGYYNIVLNGPTAAPYSTSNLIENNMLTDFYSQGLWMRGQVNTIVRGNDISRSNLTAITTFYGINISGYQEGVRISENRIHSIADASPNTLASSYGLFMSSATGTAANPLVLANNLVYKMNTVGQVYAIHIVGTSNYIHVYHNTLSLENYGTSTSTQRVVNMLSSSGNFVFKNNIFNLTSGSTGAKYLVYLTSTVPTVELNYNQYYIDGAGTAANNSIGYWGANFASFTDWKAANSSAFEANGVNGNPIFTDLSMDNLTPIGATGNDAGANLLAQVPTDYYGVARTATPDIGAIEFTPVVADIALSSANIKRGQCLSPADTVLLEVTNIVGNAISFATDTLVANWTVTGPVNSSGTIVRDTGTLAMGASVTLAAFTANLSVPGIYTFNAWINANDVNLISNNDTIANVNFEIVPLFEATPKTATILNALDTVEISVKSPFLNGSSFFISEICQYKYKSGGPVLGWPTYILADDYIEITGIAGADLGGITLEQWSDTSLLSTYTFPSGTLLSPAGTAIIAVGQLGLSVPVPSNYYYHGTGTSTVAFAATDIAGRILKNASNNIIDAVGYGTYTFPAAANVSATDWSGATPALFGSGNTLNGPDNNSAANWVLASAVSQTPNALNSNVVSPNPQASSGFTWSFNGSVIDTVVNIFVGPFAVPGVYKYVATYQNSPCGVLTDTVTINVSYIVVCPAPTNASASAANCASTTLSWTSGASTLSTRIEYGPIGFTPGTGNFLMGASAPQVISGLAPGTAYDFYIRDSCAAGKSVQIKVTDTTASGPMPTAAGVFSIVTVGATGADVQFDASTSTNYTTVSWDFGDLTPLVTGVNPLHTYAANGTYTVTVVANSTCGADTTTLQVVITGIGLLENEIFNNLLIYPNPNLGNFNISFVVDMPTTIEMSVVNVQGQVLFNKNYGQTQGIFKEAISLENVPAGMYLLQIVTNRGTITKRVTVGK